MPTRNGTEDDDILYGSIGDDTISALGGDDIIYTRGGRDAVDAGAGNDVIHFFHRAKGDRPSSIKGGEGYDTLYVNSPFGGGVISYSVQSFERICGGRDREQMDGRGATVALTYFGRGGNDDISGGSGDDRLIGGSGNDDLLGHEGDDILRGGDGIDRLFGKEGRDIMSGGQGADRFIFQIESDFAGMGNVTCDRITDFNSGQGDQIYLNGVDADTTNDVNRRDDHFTFIADAAFSGTAGELRYEYIYGHTYVMGDTNGDADADFWIRLDGEHALTADDFLL